MDVRIKRAIREARSGSQRRARRRWFPKRSSGRPSASAFPRSQPRSMRVFYSLPCQNLLLVCDAHSASGMHSICFPFRSVLLRNTVIITHTGGYCKSFFAIFNARIAFFEKRNRRACALRDISAVIERLPHFSIFENGKNDDQCNRTEYDRSHKKQKTNDECDNCDKERQDVW